MHIYVAGLGGAGMGPLAQMAHQIGHRISGSDLKDSDALAAMRKWQPAPTINITQTASQIAAVHARQPIDWYIYSSALEWAHPPNEELAWVKQNNIKYSKRDEFLNYLLEVCQLRLLALAGSHGKTTSTALMIWLNHQLGEEISYAVGGRLLDWPPAQINPKSDWFIYEADEFDRNFLAFKPQLSLITGIDYDHPESFPTWQDYKAAFWQFIAQSEQTLISEHDLKRLEPLPENLSAKIIPITSRPHDHRLTLAGAVNRENATLVLAGAKIIKPEIEEQELIQILNRFPGCWRRFEEVAANVYSDYAHNPTKIAGCLQRALELEKPLVVVYEPHSNARQHLVKEQYEQLFEKVDRLYWLPTFLSRENPNLKILTPAELISILTNPEVAEVAEMNDELRDKLKEHLRDGAVIVAMSAGDLDDWLRQNLGEKEFLKF